MGELLKGPLCLDNGVVDGNRVVALDVAGPVPSAGFKPRYQRLINDLCKAVHAQSEAELANLLDGETVDVLEGLLTYSLKGHNKGILG